MIRIMIEYFKTGVTVMDKEVQLLLAAHQPDRTKLNQPTS